MWQCVFPSNYSDVRCQHARSKASSVGVNSHPAFDEKPGIMFVWPKLATKLPMGRGQHFLVAVLNSDIVALIGLHKGQRREKGEGARGIHKGQGEATKKQVGAVRLAT